MFILSDGVISFVFVSVRSLFGLLLGCARAVLFVLCDVMAPTPVLMSVSRSFPAQLWLQLDPQTAVLRAESLRLRLSYGRVQHGDTLHAAAGQVRS